MLAADLTIHPFYGPSNWQPLALHRMITAVGLFLPYYAYQTTA